MTSCPRVFLAAPHVKQRLLGHWGTSPGLAFAHVHLNRLIKKYDLDTIFLAGPGHGAPGVLAPVYLEGAYPEVYRAEQAGQQVEVHSAGRASQKDIRV